MVSLIRKIKDYVLDNRLKINILGDELNIVNYLDIVTIEENRVCIMAENKKIIIKGKNIALNKLLENEVLISGNIKSIELE